jgi:hypothetical protein
MRQYRWFNHKQMSKVFFSVSVSLDGYLVPPGMDLEHAGDPTHEDWAAQWGKLQSWIFPTRFFRERLKLGEGGEEIDAPYWPADIPKEGTRKVPMARVVYIDRDHLHSYACTPEQTQSMTRDLTQYQP